MVRKTKFQVMGHISKNLHVPKDSVDIQDVSPLLGSLLSEPPMVSFRRPRNLKDRLVRAKLKANNETTRGMFCCGKARCKVCNFVKTGSTFNSNVEGRSFHISHSFDCDSRFQVEWCT